MGGPSRSTRGREDAIETLIDMDPNGSAFRVAKTMVSIELLYGNFFIGCHVYVCLSVHVVEVIGPPFLLVVASLLHSPICLFVYIRNISSILYLYYLSHM